MNQLLILVVASISLGVAAISLLAGLAVLKKKNKELAKELLERTNASSESYVKFLSDSRDWAYQYIEEVQAGLTKFSEQVEPQLDYFNTYGRAVPSHNDIALDLITKAYTDLKTLLPEENKEK